MNYISAQLQQTLAILPRKDLDTVSMIPVNHPIYDVGQTLTFAFFSQFDGLAIFLNTPDLFKGQWAHWKFGLDSLTTVNMG